MSEVAPNSRSWPRISIVTPSFNQGQFIEETIRSILLQGYPDLEYIIIDGGSTDNSVEIIRKYESWLAYWVSEKDEGQADAIYRGFQIATGEYSSWLNSDDVYLPAALNTVAEHVVRHPNHEMIMGGCLYIGENSQALLGSSGYPLYYPGYNLSFRETLLWGMGRNQPAMFWKRERFFDVGGFDDSLEYCFDYDLILRLTRRGRFRKLSRMIACFRMHGTSKTMSCQEGFLEERSALRQQYGYNSYLRGVRKSWRKYYCHFGVWKRRILLLRYKLGLMRIPGSVSEAKIGSTKRTRV